MNIEIAYFSHQGNSSFIRFNRNIKSILIETEPTEGIVI